MGSAGGWLCASRSALALMVVGQWRGGVAWCGGARPCARPSTAGDPHRPLSRHSET
ncbi:uncharacterized protein SCHCODRAFT_02620018 [Schizophyllum commune H4-8]|uniref:uncharacterized protein n=1 Tax=Schizophyllum commune (strain H4-8 / FGSC 9210) TaxID=578458 RepID=UPI00215E4DDD|nr:uncharacterized protein SCHCODRAFT_02620000 [Schizophyllum commune H4-8]XP_050201305.1 uncharacterized protein SCHCODRAFT_02620018 [Schizophyllum commune H4-8]KAI5895650.1 hypothetical protein SCHCODRAFT_02620000 [Schizophyllum commune H4-8]KAI5895655.1 hypothetical protein SCHCODRAFT_02620018 [Schizophyllum commune H4-8]